MQDICPYLEALCSTGCRHEAAADVVWHRDEDALAEHKSARDELAATRFCRYEPTRLNVVVQPEGTRVVLEDE